MDAEDTNLIDNRSFLVRENPMFRRRWYFIFFGFVTFVLIGVAGTGLWIERLASAPDFKNRLEKAASDYLERPLTIERLTWRRWPTWKLTGESVRLWETAPRQAVMIEAPTVEASITLLSFYKAVIGISDIKLISPRYIVREDANGRNNLAGLIEDLLEKPDTASRQWGKVVFAQLSIKEGAFSAGSAHIIINDGRIKFLTGKSNFTGVVTSSTAAADFELAITPSPRFEAVLDLPQARVRSSTVKNVHAVIRRTGGSYTLDKTRFECLGGTLAVSGTYDTTASTDALKIDWQSDDIQIRDLFAFAGSEAEGSGRLDSTGSLTSKPADFLRFLNGTVSVRLKDGWFGNTKGLLKVISRLNLATLITEVKGDHVSRVPFDDTRGTFNIINGVAATTEPFVLKNKTMEMAFMGSYNLPEKTIDGRIVVNILLVTDEVISKIPLVRDILLGGEKGLLPIWLSVKGDAADPKIKVLSIKSIAAPVWNTIANTLKIPQKVFEKITGE